MNGLQAFISKCFGQRRKPASSWGPGTGISLATGYNGARVTFDATNGIRGFDSSGNVLTHIKVDGTVELKTSANGSRLTLDATDGLVGYDADDNILTQIDTDGRLKCVSVGCTSDADDYLQFHGSGWFQFVSQSSYGLGVQVNSGNSRIYAAAGLFDNSDLHLSGYKSTDSVKICSNVGATVIATFNSAGLNFESGKVIKINSTQVVGAQQGAIAAPSGGGTQDAEARTAIGSILTALRNHGLIAT